MGVRRADRVLSGTQSKDDGEEKANTRPGSREGAARMTRVTAASHVAPFGSDPWKCSPADPQRRKALSSHTELFTI